MESFNEFNKEIKKLEEEKKELKKDFGIFNINLLQT